MVLPVTILIKRNLSLLVQTLLLKSYIVRLQLFYSANLGFVRRNFASIICRNTSGILFDQVNLDSLGYQLFCLRRIDILFGKLVVRDVLSIRIRNNV